MSVKKLIMRMLFPSPARGESASPKGIKTSIVPGGISAEEWEKGGYHSYFWGKMEEKVAQLKTDE